MRFVLLTWGWKSKAAAALINQVGIAGRLAPEDRFFALGYHRIRVGPADDGWDPSLIGPTAEQFREQMRWLRKHTHLLSAEELIGHVNSGESLPPKSAIVTFDDAYRDNYTHALPVLQELGVPAVLFVPTGLVEQQTPGWWEQIYWIISNSSATSCSIGDQTFSLPEQVSDAIAFAQDHMKTRPAHQTSDFVEDLAKQLGVSRGPWQQGSGLLMSWDEIRECDRAGFHVGCHTVTHRVLSTLSPADQRAEIKESKQRLEQELSRPVEILAYPVGEERHITAETPGIAEELGIKAAFTFYTGMGLLDDVHAHPHLIRRFAPGETKRQLVAQIALPQIFI